MSLDFLPLRIFNDHGPRIVWAGTRPPLPSVFRVGLRSSSRGRTRARYFPCNAHPPRAAGRRVCLPTFIQLSSPLQLLKPLDEPICGDQRARGEGIDPGSLEPGLGGARWPPEENQEQHRAGCQGWGLGTRVGWARWCFVMSPVHPDKGGQQGDPQEAPVISTTPEGWDTQKGQKSDKDAGASRREE